MSFLLLKPILVSPHCTFLEKVLFGLQVLPPIICLPHPSMPLSPHLLPLSPLSRCSSLRPFFCLSNTQAYCYLRAFAPAIPSAWTTSSCSLQRGFPFCHSGPSFSHLLREAFSDHLPLIVCFSFLHSTYYHLMVSC